MRFREWFPRTLTHCIFVTPEIAYVILETGRFREAIAQIYIDARIKIILPTRRQSQLPSFSRHCYTNPMTLKEDKFDNSHYDKYFAIPALTLRNIKPALWQGQNKTADFAAL